MIYIQLFDVEEQSGRSASDFSMGPVMTMQRKACITWAHFMLQIDPTGHPAAPPFH